MDREKLEGLRLSAHAQATMAARDVSPEEVAEALLHPEIVEPHEGRLRYVRGSLAVVVAEGKDGAPVVVTVLLRTTRKWTSGDMRRR